MKTERDLINFCIECYAEIQRVKNNKNLTKNIIMSEWAFIDGKIETARIILGLPKDEFLELIKEYKQLNKL